ncbi:coiled-coil domain-containing protein [Microbacterium tumbae]
MAGFWGRRRREQEAKAAQDADLARRAEQALVAADERIRTAADELVFAEAELGASLTKDLAAALDAVRTHLREAFQLHQLNHDEIPDTEEELRTRNARIVQLCEWAEDLLEEKTTALAAQVARVRQAPQIIAQLRRDADALTARIPQARATIERLSSRYADSAVHQIAASDDEAAQLVAFATHGADVSERRRAARKNEEANLALEAATEAIRRAGVVLDAVEDFEIEALRAESTLAEVIADSRGDVIAARTAPQVPAVADAVAELESALGSLSPAGARNDPFAELSRLRTANSALDEVIAKARHRAEHPLPSVAQVQHALDDADRQLGVARSLIAGHRGWIGADARTRLAEAERLRIDVPERIAAEDTREEALTGARRVAQLAAEALQLAQRDIDSARPPQQPYDDWGGGGWGGGGRRGGGGGDLASGILGGLVIGSILDGIFD